MANARRPLELRAIVLPALLALAALGALAVPARADIAAIGTATIDSDTTVDPVTFTGGLAFDAGSFSVNGVPVDLAGDVGTMNLTMGTFDFTDLSHVTVAFHAESNTPGLLAFDVEGSVVCGNDCLNGTTVLVGRPTNVGGSVALPGATYVLETALVLFEGDGSGKLGLNAFQSLATPADLDVTVSSSGDYFNSRHQAAEPFAAYVTFDEVSQAGETLMTAASSGAGALPFDITKAIPPFMDMSTSAQTHGSILVCLHFDDADHDGLEDTSRTPTRRLRLLHTSSAGAAFVDVTETDVDDFICGFPPISLARFVLGAKACASDDDCADDNPCTADSCDTEFGECSNDVLPECVTPTTSTTAAPTTTQLPTTTTETTTTTTTTTQLGCGNGQVEGDEQCDSGSPGGGFVGGDCGFCTSSCECEPTTTTTEAPTTTSTTTSSTTTTLVIPTTSTAAPTTTTSSTSTTSSTTSTTLPGCTNEETFASVLCRLDELIALVSASEVQDPLKKNLLNGLARGRKRLVDAEARFDAGRFKSARSKLKGTTRRLIGFVHRIEGLTGRRGIPDDLATEWTARADDIAQDIPGLVP